MAKRKDSKYLQVNFRLPHPVTGETTRIRFSSGTTDPVEFQKIVSLAKADFLRGTFDPAIYGTTSKKFASRTFKSVAVDVYDRLWVRKPASDSYWWNIVSMVAFFGESKVCATLSTKDIDAYMMHLDDVGNAHQTKKMKFTRLRTIIETAEQLELIPKLNINWEVCRPVNPARKTFRNEFYYTPEVQDKFVAQFHKQGRSDVADFFNFLIETGLRKGEALALSWTDVSWGDRSVLVRGQDTGGGKTSAARRSVPLTGKAYAILERKRPRDMHGILWPVFSLTRDGLKKVFETARSNLGYTGKSGVTLHACRHTCATRLAQTGRVTPFELKAWMGWESIVMADTYVNLFGGSLNKLRDQLENVEAKRSREEIINRINELQAVLKELP